MEKLADISQFESFTSTAGRSVFNFGGWGERLEDDHSTIDEVEYERKKRNRFGPEKELDADTLDQMVYDAIDQYISEMEQNGSGEQGNKGAVNNKRATPTRRLNIKPRNEKRVSTKNAISLTKQPAGSGVNLSKDNLRPYFGMIADGVGGLLASGVTPNSILRYCQQRISQSTQFDQQRAQQMGKNMSGSVMGMLKQHARAVPVQ